MRWNSRWLGLWLLLLAAFFVLEGIGIIAEHLGIPGVSTLSQWLVANLGWQLTSVLTLIAAGLLILHWYLIEKGQDANPDSLL